MGRMVRDVYDVHMILMTLGLFVFRSEERVSLTAQETQHISTQTTPSPPLSSLWA